MRKCYLLIGSSLILALYGGEPPDNSSRSALPQDLSSNNYTDKIDKIEEKPDEVVKLENGHELYKYYDPSKKYVCKDVVVKDGKPDGLRKHYDPSGRVLGILTYIDGKPRGFTISYYSNGNPASFTSSQGEDVFGGWSIVFKRDGTIRSIREPQK